MKTRASFFADAAAAVAARGPRPPPLPNPAPRPSIREAPALFDDGEGITGLEAPPIGLGAHASALAAAATARLAPQRSRLLAAADRAAPLSASIRAALAAPKTVPLALARELAEAARTLRAEICIDDDSLWVGVLAFPILAVRSLNASVEAADAVVVAMEVLKKGSLRVSDAARAAVEGGGPRALPAPPVRAVETALDVTIRACAKVKFAVAGATFNDGLHGVLARADVYDLIQAARATCVSAAMQLIEDVLPGWVSRLRSASVSNRFDAAAHLTAVRQITRSILQAARELRDSSDGGSPSMPSMLDTHVERMAAISSADNADAAVAAWDDGRGAISETVGRTHYHTHIVARGLAALTSGGDDALCEELSKWTSEAGPDLSVALTETTSGGMSLVRAAAAGGHLSSLAALLAAGLDAAFVYADGSTALHAAASAPSRAAASALTALLAALPSGVARAAALNTRNAAGQTPAHIVARSPMISCSERARILATLVRAGGDAWAADAFSKTPCEALASTIPLHSAAVPASNMPSMPTPTPLAQFFESRELSDVRLLIIDANGGDVDIPAHRVVLASASSFFRAAFREGTWTEGRGGAASVRVDVGGSFPSVRAAIAFSYIGALSDAAAIVPPHDASAALERLRVADALGMPALRDAVLRELRDSALSPRVAFAILTATRELAMSGVSEAVAVVFAAAREALMHQQDAGLADDGGHALLTVLDTVAELA